ncbi:MAG: zinc-dependent metalloprotease family protein [Flavobacterium sp.]
MKKTLLLLIMSFSFGQIVAQNNSLWISEGSSEVSKLKRTRTNNVCDGELYFSLNLGAFKQSLANAKDKFSNLPGVSIQLPNLNGEMETFLVWENSNFTPELQARFPEIRAYVGKGISDKSATVNLSFSPQGIQTMVFRANTGTEFIEAYDKAATTYVLFNSSKRISGRLPFNCSTDDVALTNSISDNIANTTFSDNAKYKTFRLALSCTAEYSNYFGATSSANVALVIAAFNATMTRVNGVLEKDLAVHFNLIPTTDQVIFYNASTDPYSTSAVGTAIANANNANGWNIQLQNTLTNTLGNAAYDIGHLFGADGGGGNAGCIGCICTDDTTSTTDKNKGSGFTSPGDGVPAGDTFDIDYVVHEMGHQMGANHSFTYNYEGTTAQVEPGSGNSIMGYAGVATTTAGAPAFNVQAHSDALFCYKNILQIQTNLNGTSCAVTTDLGGLNATPTAIGPGNFSIPIGTAFKLTGSSTDADAGDSLTYSWEQNNVGTSATTQANSRVVATKTAGPNFKIFPASSSPTRYFPQWNRILSGNLLVTTASDATWETLSSVGRTMNFTFTVRDNHPGMGQTKTATASVITVVNTGSAFAITNPTTENITWDPGATATVTWDVAGTTANGINTANVNILFSTDGGATFPYVLASATANDGSESITIPNTTSPNCRLMIEAVGNIFFAVSKNIALGYSVVNACNTYTYSTATPIIDQAPGSYTTRTINVGEGGTISSVSVFNRLTHTYLSDVQTDISSPQNPTTFVKMLNRSCGNTSGTLNLKFNDAGGAINCSGGTTLQTVIPSEPLSSFIGQNSQGTWTFRVYDNYTGDTGSVASWGLEICTQTVTQLANLENQIRDFAIFPNPSKGNFNIQFENHSLNEIKVNVYDMRGRAIFENKYSNQVTFNENIQLNNAQAGIYLVTITDGKQKLTKRLVIE